MEPRSSPGLKAVPSEKTRLSDYLAGFLKVAVSNAAKPASELQR